MLQIMTAQGGAEEYNHDGGACMLLRKPSGPVGFEVRRGEIWNQC